MKKVISVFLAILFISMTFAGCSTVKNVTSSIKESFSNISLFSSKKKSDITIDNLYNANAIDTLISLYGTVKLTKTDAVSTSVEYFFLKDGVTVSAFKGVDSNNFENYSGCYGAYSYYLLDDHYICFDKIDSYENPTDFIYQNGISSAIVQGEITDIERDGKFYTFSILDEYDITKCSYTVDRTNLSLQKGTYFADGSEVDFEISYGVEVEEFGLLEGWEKELKTVTVVNSFTDAEGNTTVDTKELKLPLDLEYIPQYGYETEKYLDEEHTVFYQYPGNGVDYTLYITNVLVTEEVIGETEETTDEPGTDIAVDVPEESQKDVNLE